LGRNILGVFNHGLGIRPSYRQNFDQQLRTLL
jgi:hypothetical protein